MEHTVKDLVQWQGDRGKLYFYQSELPYDVSHQDFCEPGYAGYVVGDSVRAHTAVGVGVYSYFRDSECLLPSAIKAPVGQGIEFISTFIRHLNGYGGILGIMNGRGPAVGPGMSRWDTRTNVSAVRLQKTAGPTSGSCSGGQVQMSYGELLVVILASAGLGVVMTSVLAFPQCKELLGFDKNQEERESHRMIEEDSCL